jgi:hypothetical protein
MKQEDALFPLFFTFAYEYAIKKVQKSQVRLKMSWVHKILVYSDDVDVLSTVQC